MLLDVTFKTCSPGSNAPEEKTIVLDTMPFLTRSASKSVGMGAVWGELLSIWYVARSPGVVVFRNVPKAATYVPRCILIS